MTTITVIGFVVGIIGVGLTAYGVWLALRSRNRRRLAWDVRANPLIGSDARLRGELDISFHGEKVADPHTVTVEIRNTGDAPLRADDFIDPVSIRFEPGSYWMMAAVVADPDERAVPFDKEGGVVSFRPQLLQPLESVYVHGLFEGDPGEPVPSARVVGVKNLEPLDRQQPFSELLATAALEALRNITSVSFMGITFDRTGTRD